jgi:hypothetical protein
MFAFEDSFREFRIGEICYSLLIRFVKYAIFSPALRRAEKQDL